MHENTVAKILFIIGVAQITIGIFVGLLFGFENTGFGNQFGWALFFTWTFGGITLGMLFIGFAENIQLLHRICIGMDVKEPEQDQVRLKDSPPIESEGWFLPFEDRQKIEAYYKNETIIEIIPSNIEGYCIVKLEYNSNEFVRVVGVHGFDVREIQDEVIKSQNITWYNNQP